MNLKICKKWLVLLVALLAMGGVCRAADGKFTLVLDAGHGGRDSGCKGTIAQEKDINLRATLMLGRLIADNCKDVKIIYTRSTDVFIPLHQRADIANKAKADLFISIHTNSGPHTPTAKGFETWTMGMRRSDEKLSAAKRENDVILIEQDYEQHYAGYDPNSPESNIMFEFMLDKNMEKSVELARGIQDRVCGVYGRANRGVRQDVFLVLRETSMPACLVELGFITNAEEQELMASDSTLAPTVEGIYEAFVKYKNKYTGTNTPIVTRTASATPRTAALDQADSKPTATESKAATTEKAQTKPDTTQTTPAKEAAAQTASTDSIVYKVQILAVNRQLRSDSELLKGHNEAEPFREGNMVKYMLGSSADYNEVARLRRKVLADFPEAFIVAFHNGQKIAASEARQLQAQKK